METSDADSCPKLDRAAVMLALSAPVLWDILGLLAKGTALSVSDMAGQLGLDADLVSKHLRVLREAGVVAVERDTGNDARRQLYAVPGAFVVTAGVVDFGFCLLRFG